ncbi:hypothetical protein JTB14_035399 [Gonioctena quinquepunctata]|nr:hypothetical protein JTB14_035399 [Gonioctena quinquepunctata]
MLKLENNLLKRLITEMEDKNNILKENDFLLLQTIKGMEQKTQHQVKEKTHSNDVNKTKEINFSQNTAKTPLQIIETRCIQQCCKKNSPNPVLPTTVRHHIKQMAKSKECTIGKEIKMATLKMRTLTVMTRTVPMII